MKKRHLCVAISKYRIQVDYSALVQQVVNGGETNYVRATLSIYIDIMNIFINLLNILRGSSD